MRANKTMTFEQLFQEGHLLQEMLTRMKMIEFVSIKLWLKMKICFKALKDSQQSSVSSQKEEKYE